MIDAQLRELLHQAKVKETNPGVIVLDFDALRRIIDAIKPATKNDQAFFKHIPLMNALDEQAATKGICPRCHTKTLEHAHTGEEIEFHQCRSCKDVVVLSSLEK